jgi:ankyrin repeat protein
VYNRLYIGSYKPINAVDKNLLDAAKRGAIDEVRQFLGEGAKPNAKGDSGLTPLHNAAKGNNPDVVKLLLNNGANPNAKDDSGNTPLHDAAQGGHDDSKVASQQRQRSRDTKRG